MLNPVLSLQYSESNSSENRKYLLVLWRNETIKAKNFYKADKRQGEECTHMY